MKKLKLTLNKETIAKLEDEKMDAVVGGSGSCLGTCIDFNTCIGVSCQYCIPKTVVPCATEAADCPSKAC